MTPSYFRIGGKLRAEDRRAAVRCRICRADGSTRVAPGLYALGSPSAESPVLLSGSWRLTFDRLRSDCSGRDLWIVVADTGALDVASAVAAGRLGTAEIAQALKSSRVAELTTRRDVVVPPSAARAVNVEALRSATGFMPVAGPRSSRDLPRFLDAGCRLEPPMEETTFTAVERLALTPSEIVRSLMLFPGFAFAALIYAGLGAGGVSVERALADGWQLLVLGLASIACGSFVAPLTPPARPRPPYFVRGWVCGMAETAALVLGTPLLAGRGLFLRAAALLFFPGAAAALAARFCAASPLVVPADIARERRAFLIPGILLAVASVVCFVLAKTAPPVR